jgi:hypothetical protein
MIHVVKAGHNRRGLPNNRGRRDSAVPTGVLAVIVSVAITLSACGAGGPDLSGAWQGKTTTTGFRNPKAMETGDVDIIFTQEKKSLSGSVTWKTAHGESVLFKIVSGVISQGRINFVGNYDGGSVKSNMTFVGTVAGNSLTGDIEVTLDNSNFGVMRAKGSLKADRK